jgi:hypothetical protein
MTTETPIQSILDAIEEIGYSGVMFTRAKTKAELDRAFANATRFTAQVEQAAKANEAEFVRILESEYKAAGGTGAVPKRYADKAKRIRAQYQKSATQASADMRVWMREQAERTAKSKAKEASNTRLKDLQRKFEVRGLDKKENEEYQRLLTIRRQASDDKFLSDDPTVIRRRKGKGGKVTSYKISAEAHFRMATTTAQNLHRNLGVVAAASKASGYVIVFDGAACGRKSHNDPDKINGQVWSVDEAFTHPLGHPNCTRRFVVADGPPGSKKVKDQLKGMKISTGTQKTSRQRVKQVAKAASAVSIVGAVAGEVVTNPFVKRFMREILSDAELVLPEAVRAALVRLTSYANRELGAFQEHGSRLGISSQEQFNDYVAKSFDEDFATRAFIDADLDSNVKLRIEQARVLGLPTVVSKVRLLEALDDYGDWTLHRDSMILPISERIKERNIWRAVREDVYGEAAIQYHIMRPPGINADRRWSRVLNDLAETYRKDPDRAKVDAVKLAAAVFDPTPWVRFPLPGKLSFTIGMPVRSRQEIAVKVYTKLGGVWKMSDAEIRWAQQLGMDLRDVAAKQARMTMDDMIQLLAPRLTWTPTSLFHATINMENGVIRPTVRAFPHGTYSRFLSLESRLARLDVREFIKYLNDEDFLKLPVPQRIAKAARESFDPEIATAVNLFRHSPVEVNMYMNGLDPAGFGLRLLPDNRFLRYSYRASFDQRPSYNTLNKDDLLRLADDREMWELPGDLTRQQIIDELVIWDRAALKKFSQDLRTGTLAGRSFTDIIAEQPVGVQELLQQITDGWQKGLTVLPDRVFGFNLHSLDLNGREAVFRMRAAGYSLLRISKETRFGYDSLLDIFAERRDMIQNQARYWKNTLQNVRSYDDLKLAIQEQFRGQERLYESLYNAKNKVDLGHVKFDVDQYPELKTDLEIFTQSWERMFPGLSLPEFRIVQNGPPMQYRNGTININQEVADNYKDWLSYRRKSAKLGWFPADTGPGVASLFHEGAHHYIANMTRTQKLNLRRAVFREYSTWGAQMTGKNAETLEEFDRWFFNDKNQELIARRVSAYATTSWDELIAEALSEYLTSPDPRRIATVVGQRILLGRRLTVAT